MPKQVLPITTFQGLYTFPDAQDIPDGGFSTFSNALLTPPGQITVMPVADEYNSSIDYLDISNNVGDRKSVV